MELCSVRWDIGTRGDQISSARSRCKQAGSTAISSFSNSSKVMAQIWNHSSLPEVNQNYVRYTPVYLQNPFELTHFSAKLFYSAILKKGYCPRTALRMMYSVALKIHFYPLFTPFCPLPLPWKTCQLKLGYAGSLVHWISISLPNSSGTPTT